MDSIERACEEAAELAAAAYEDGQAMMAAMIAADPESERTSAYLGMRDRQTALASFQVTADTYRAWRETEIGYLAEIASLRGELAAERAAGGRPRLSAVASR